MFSRQGFITSSSKINYGGAKKNQVRPWLKKLFNLQISVPRSRDCVLFGQRQGSKTCGLRWPKKCAGSGDEIEVSFVHNINLLLVIIKDKGVRSMISIPGSLFFVMSSAPAKKYAGDARCASQDPSTQRCLLQSRLKSALGVRSSYVESKKSNFMLEKRFFVKYLSSFHLHTAKAP